MQRKQQLVVIGNGMAGARTVEELLTRGGGEAYEITIFGEEPHGSYNRVLLSGALSGVYRTRDLLLHPIGWYEENGIRLHTGARIVAIDRDGRAVVAEDGRRTPYDRLVLATGSRPVVPPIRGLRAPDGGLRPGVFVFRTLEDCRQIREAAQSAATAAVLGGGLLGLEAAHGLRQLGLEVHLLHRGAHLLNRQLDAEAGAILARAVEQLGIRVHLRASAAAIRGGARVETLELADGRALPCDLVVLACGIRPNVELAAGCGLEVRRGIVVDDRMRSVTDPRICAVGECAEHRGRIYGLVAPVWEQAQVLAEALAGRKPDSAYRGSRTAARLKVAGLEVVSLGLVEPESPADEVVRFSEPRRGVYKKLIIRDGALVGATLLGDGERAPYLMQVFDRGTPLPEERAALLFDLGGRPGATPLESLGDEATICHCNGVRKGEIRECVAGGGCSLQSVMRATRAGTGCGSCKLLLRELLDRFLREKRDRPAEVAG